MSDHNRGIVNEIVKIIGCDQFVEEQIRSTQLFFKI